MNPPNYYRWYWSPGEQHVLLDRDEAREWVTQRLTTRPDLFASLNAYATPDVAQPHYYDYAFDFDGPAETTKDEAQRLAHWLVVRRVAHRLYESGSKGYHVVVSARNVDVPVLENAGRVCREFQRELAECLGLTTLDWRIHNRRRLFRLPGSLHAVTLRRKIEISAYKPLTPAKLVVSGWEHKALVPEPPPREVLSFEPVCMAELLNWPADVQRRGGASRNELTFLAATYMSARGVPQADARARLTVLADCLTSSSSPEQVRHSTTTCVASVYATDARFSCGNARARGCLCHSSCPKWRNFAQDDPETLEHYDASPQG